MEFKDCQNPNCGGLAMYTVSTVTGRSPIDACKRHLTWAVEFIGHSGGAVTVMLREVGNRS